MRHTRVWHRVAQTPVVRYENRKTGRTVTLIGLMHSGTAAEEEWAGAAEGERAVRGLSEPIDDRAFQAVCRYLGWVGQRAGLKYSPSWCNVDLTDLEVIRQTQPRNISEMSHDFSDVAAGLTPEQSVWVPVGELPAVWPCLRVFWTSMRSSGAEDSANGS